jgi:hypothetical protein
VVSALAVAIVAELDEDALDMLAERLAPRLAASDPADGELDLVTGMPSSGATTVAVVSSTRRLVDARTLATALGCSRDCVYTHAIELGGQRIGSGPRGRLRFDLDRALEAWTSRLDSKESQEAKAPATPGRSASCRRRAMGSTAGLLPIKGPLTPVPNDRERS